MLNLIEKTRSFRRFAEDRQIPEADLRQLVDLARLGGSAANQQPWQYMVVTEPQLCETIFPHIGWAGYLKDWKGPIQGERPSCYILCLLNQNWLKVSEASAQFDLGVATQNLLLGAMEKGIGGCRIGAFSPRIKEHLIVPEHLELSLIIALGYPVEEVIISELPEPNDIKYWRDEQGLHYVPKRSLEDILITLDLK